MSDRDRRRHLDVEGSGGSNNGQPNQRSMDDWDLVNDLDLKPASKDVSMRFDPQKATGQPVSIPLRTRSTNATAGWDNYSVSQSSALPEQPLDQIPRAPEFKSYSAAGTARAPVGATQQRQPSRDDDSTINPQRFSLHDSSPQGPTTQSRGTVVRIQMNPSGTDKRPGGPSPGKDSHVPTARMPSDASSQQRWSPPSEQGHQDSIGPVTSREPQPSGNQRFQGATTPKQLSLEQSPPRSRGDPKSIAKEVQDFIDEVQFGDIQSCGQFINDHPAILREPGIRTELLSRAEQGLIRNDLPLTKSCIEKALMVKTCRGLSQDDITEFFRKLHVNDKQALREFSVEFNGILREMHQRFAIWLVDDSRRQIPTRQPSILQPASRSRSGRTAPVYHFEGASQPSVLSSTHPPAETPVTVTSLGNLPPMSRNSVSGPFQPGGQEPTPRKWRAIDMLEISKKRRAQDTVVWSPHSNEAGIYESPPSRPVTSLDPSWQIRPSVYFKVGRVFAALSHDSVSEVRPRQSPAGLTTVVSRFGTQIHTSVRRFVVVKEMHGCSWVVPITTYQGRGLSKGSLSPQDIQAHAVIYDADQGPPVQQHDEHQSPNRPLGMQTSSGNKLSPSSLINFAKIYTVEHNVKVKDIGIISEESLPYFTFYWKRQVTQ